MEIRRSVAKWNGSKMLPDASNSVQCGCEPCFLALLGLVTHNRNILHMTLKNTFILLLSWVSNKQQQTDITSDGMDGRRESGNKRELCVGKLLQAMYLKLRARTIVEILLFAWVLCVILLVTGKKSYYYQYCVTLQCVTLNTVCRYYSLALTWP